MKYGKPELHELPVPDIVSLGAYADQLQLEAEARGEVLPPPIRLQIGEPDFRTPEHIRQAAIESITNEVQTYGPAGGWPWLRERLAEKVRQINGYQVDASNIAVSMGGTGGLLSTLLATLNPGDEVLIPDPCWPIYLPQLQIAGAIAVRYPLDPANDWLPDLSRLDEQVTPRTRMLLINTPGNPTGAVFPRTVIAELLEFARRHDLYLLSDECYDQLVFEGEHISPATLLSRQELEEGRFIGIYTFSKAYAMTGWRIGYVVAGTRLIKTLVDVLNANLTNISTPIQRAALAALTGPQDCIEVMRESYRRRRDLVVAQLKAAGRYSYTPHGAFYTLIDVSSRHGEPRGGRQFSLDLIGVSNVTVTPGQGFGAISDEYVRISLAASEQALLLGVQAICRLADR
ncbi:aspartate aminotransferase [Dictyobacter alpinus]|uniref:Aspartate aminotransferase n=1 Tax=Dictyobacter alpinus TaxID=2014873 RepID=A0A402B526_9CHLR|nr:pyridoxal phosphate-dependent aminotransferase [Dictyobacter alpinus]GCE26449.1 aspartate aminotransferase [Dictyobacter alpinus]